MFKRFFKRRDGATAITFALSAIPLMMSVGATIDYSRYTRAESYLQTLNDAAALAAAGAKSKNEAVLRRLADDYMATRVDTSILASVSTQRVTLGEDDSVEVVVQSTIPMTFMAAFGFDELPVTTESTAVRGFPGSVELALVLDNTWSMSESAGGMTRIAALKSAANLLVDEVTEDEQVDIRIGLVPYADYVNVGTGNRGKSWLDVRADYSRYTPRTCTTLTTSRECTRTQVGPRKTCTTYVDGVAETYDCTTFQSTCRTVEVPPYESCSGGGTTHHRWYGCVGSRKQGHLRLTDESPNFPYPGFLATSQNCLNPIIPLTETVSRIRTGINGMIINIGGYKPATYIPAGLVWGINVLSPSEPFDEGRAYDEEAKDPRKVMVLMTDGENTLSFNPGDGSHMTYGSRPGGPSRAQRLKASNDDTADLCAYAKSRGIEIFTVALAVDDPTAEGLLRGCASGADHFFDAADSDGLLAAFSSIADSLRELRLAR
jgi:Flp pilus assembly protein TadG